MYLYLDGEQSPTTHSVNPRKAYLRNDKANALTNVPAPCPIAGCTTIPTGLFKTRTSSSSYKISKGIFRGTGVASSKGGKARTTLLPYFNFTGWCGTNFIINHAFPASIRFCNLVREKSGRTSPPLLSKTNAILRKSDNGMQRFRSDIIHRGRIKEFIHHKPLIILYAFTASIIQSTIRSRRARIMIMGNSGKPIIQLS